jgi:penicillin-binding protein 1C
MDDKSPSKAKVWRCHILSTIGEHRALRILRQSRLFQLILRKRIWRLGAYLLLFLLGLKLLMFLIPLPKSGLFRSSATLVFDRNARLLRAFTARDDMWRIRTSIERISPVLQKFQLTYEDRWFYWHPGVNPAALARAFRQNLAAGRIVSGGSTLTMQIARMIEPKSRTWYHKLREILRAIQLEQRFGKRQLLEIYYNIAPYGGNIEGVAAAAWLYFGKEPSQLSFGEAALLTALPNSPTALRPDLNPKRARMARDKVLRRVFQRRLISKVEYREALAEPIPTGRQELPIIAPHFCEEIARSYPDESRIYTTLNLRSQLMIEDLLRARIHSLRNEAISNGAVIILDNRSHELIAAAGSADFWDRAAAGEVNGYRAPRSPGSALKPFIYALGFDQGVISPRHYLEDVPIDFRGGYSPENYDRKFSGTVSVQEALERSLNVPAINLLRQLGDYGLYQLLRRVKFSTVAPEDRYGLTIALGGCEVTLLELTALYSALANRGLYQLPKFRREQADCETIRLFSPGAAYLVTEILTKVTRPDLPTCWEFTSLPRIAWKTGTSYGHRDAWSIGYNPQYTVGVWVGNFSGVGQPGIIGAEAAAPLLFDIFNKVGGNLAPWFTRPRSVGTRQVCALSGGVPGPYCRHLVSESYLIDRAPQQECPFHQAFLIDIRTGYRLPPHYATTQQSISKTYIKWPPRVAAWLEGNGAPAEPIPQLLPEWQKLLPGGAPVIRSPSANYLYQLREGIDPQYQKICLEAAASNDVHKLYWFVDGKLTGTARPGEKLFYPPEIGEHWVVCQDDQGRSAKVKLMVRE